MLALITSYMIIRLEDLEEIVELEENLTKVQNDQFIGVERHDGIPLGVHIQIIPNDVIS